MKAIIQRHQVIVCSANFPLYADLSCRTMDVLAHFTEHLDVYSIDEAFLDITAVPARNRHAYAAEIRKTVGQWVGLPVSIGIAST